jgi:hypothetical protein
MEVDESEYTPALESVAVDVVCGMGFAASSVFDDGGLSEEYAAYIDALTEGPRILDRLLREPGGGGGT